MRWSEMLVLLFYKKKRREASANGKHVWFLPCNGYGDRVYRGHYDILFRRRSKSYPDADADAGADTDMDAGAGADTDMDADAGADADMDAGADTDMDADARSSSRPTNNAQAPRYRR